MSRATVAMRNIPRGDPPIHHCRTQMKRSQQDKHMIIWWFPKYRGTPETSILMGFSIINHPLLGTHIYGNPHMDLKPNYILKCRGKRLSPWPRCNPLRVLGQSFWYTINQLGGYTSEVYQRKPEVLGPAGDVCWFITSLITSLLMILYVS